MVVIVMENGEMCDKVRMEELLERDAFKILKSKYG